LTGDKSQKARGASETELRPDGWHRFSRAIDAAIKSGPMHRTEAPKPREEVNRGKHMSPRKRSKAAEKPSARSSHE